MSVSILNAGLWQRNTIATLIVYMKSLLRVITEQKFMSSRKFYEQFSIHFKRI